MGRLIIDRGRGSGNSDPKYLGAVYNTTPARGSTLAGATDSYAFMIGGRNSGYVSDAEAVNPSLTRTALANAPSSFISSNAVVAKNSAIFCVSGWGSSFAYDNDLTLHTLTSITIQRGNLLCAGVGTYSVFGGGFDSNDSAKTTVDAYNDDFTKVSSVTALSRARGFGRGVSTANHAILAGGENGSWSTKYNTVDIYDSNLTRTTGTSLSIAKAEMYSATMQGYALLAGGSKASEASYTCEYYTDALVHGTLADVQYYWCPGTHNKKNTCCILSAYRNKADMYKLDLSHQTVETAAINSSPRNAATIGRYMLFDAVDSAPYDIYAYKG